MLASSDLSPSSGLEFHLQFISRVISLLLRLTPMITVTAFILEFVTNGELPQSGSTSGQREFFQVILDAGIVREVMNPEGPTHDN